MPLRKISEVTSTNTHYVVKTYRDANADEYIVRIFVDGVESKEATYHTDKKDDALKTQAHIMDTYENLHTLPKVRSTVEIKVPVPAEETRIEQVAKPRRIPSNLFMGLFARL